MSDAQISTEVQMLSSRDLALKLLPIAGYSVATEAERETALVKLQKDLTIAPLLKSNMIRVRYLSRDPKRAMQVLDTLAAAYLDEHLQLHGNSGSFEFFDSQATEAENRLKDAQNKLLEFQQSSGVVSAAEEKHMLLQRQIDLEVALHQAEADLKDTTRRIESIKPRLEQMSPRIATQTRRVPNQYSAERMNTMLTELQNRRTELLSKYKPSERIVTQLDQQIADTQKALRNSELQASTEEVSDVNPLRQTLESELARSESSEAGLRGRLQTMYVQDRDYTAQLARLDKLIPLEQQYQRDAKLAEDNYLLYSKKREEARIGLRMDDDKIANVLLTEKPLVPSLPKSRMGPIVAVYLLVMVTGLIVATFASHMKRTVQTPWDLEAIADVPVLGTVPLHRVSLLPERMRGFN
jgi:uncharacterized protein involved in exopolysaccharide biosynthesis